MELWQKPKHVLITCLVFFTTANVILDYVFTRFQNSSFYISESLLFSTYWLLYLPLLLLTYKLTQTTQKSIFKLLIISSAIVFHMLAYPALVWILSAVFYEHTFDYWQTFNYALSAYFLKTVIVYGFSLVAFTLLNRKTEAIEQSNAARNFISSILINDNNNRKSVLDVNEILYFSANSPYIDIYHPDRKYLYTETLKALETQLNDQQFVRIHKSHIVNLDKVATIQSRQNGDYDLTLADNTMLRLSRNYAKHFKQKFSERHQLTTK